MSSRPPQPANDPSTASRRWQRRWMPSVRGPRAVLEVLLGMLGMIALCFWFQPEDPLLLAMGFPWLGVYALIFALRYGALLAALAGGCLVSAWWLFYGLGGMHAFPVEYFIGVFVMLVLGGHFSDLWSDRLAREGGINHYLGDRLKSLVNSHYLLRISHERVEKELLSNPVTLRDTLYHLRDTISDDGQTEALPQAQAFLDYFASVCQVNEAAMFAARDGGYFQESRAHIGADFVLDASAPLLRRCADTGELTHLREAGDKQESDYLVCVPIRSSQEEVLGVMVIRRMFFMALNHDTLQLILMMLSYYADSVRQQPAVAAVRRQVPDCPDDFALELVRLSRLAAQGAAASHLVALVCRKDGACASAFAQMARQRRTLDLVWTIEDPAIYTMIVLLALTTDSGVDGYVLRVENLLQTQFGVDFREARVGVYDCALDGADPGSALRAFLGRWQGNQQ